MIVGWVALIKIQFYRWEMIPILTIGNKNLGITVLKQLFNREESMAVLTIMSKMIIQDTNSCRAAHKKGFNNSSTAKDTCNPKQTNGVVWGTFQANCLTCTRKWEKQALPQISPVPPEFLEESFSLAHSLSRYRLLREHQTASQKFSIQSHRVAIRTHIKIKLSNVVSM